MYWRSLLFLAGSAVNAATLRFSCSQLVVERLDPYVDDRPVCRRILLHQEVLHNDVQVFITNMCTIHLASSTPVRTRLPIYTRS